MIHKHAVRKHAILLRIRSKDAFVVIDIKQNITYLRRTGTLYIGTQYISTRCRCTPYIGTLYIGKRYIGMRYIGTRYIDTRYIDMVHRHAVL